MDLVLRPLRQADAEAFAGLVRLAFADLAVDPPPSATLVTGDDVRAHLAAGGGGVTADPDVAGLLWVEKDSGLYVSRVAVHPERRRQGLAGHLLRAAEAEAVRRGLSRLWLSTRLSLAGNRRLFAQLGFVETAFHAHPGHTTPTFVDMEKRLGLN